MGKNGTTSINLRRLTQHVHQITQVCHIFGLFWWCLHTYVRCLLPCCSLLPGTQRARHGQSTTRGIPGDRQSRRQKPEVACNSSGHPHQRYVWWSCHYNMAWSQSCSIIQQPWSQVWQHPSPCFCMFFPSAVAYAQVSAYQTVKFLPSSLLWPIVKNLLGQRSPVQECNTILQFASVCYTLLYDLQLWNASFVSTGPSIGRATKQCSVGATWRIRYWNSLKQWQLMEWSPHDVWGSLGPLLLAIFECLPWSPEGHVEVLKKSQAQAVFTDDIQVPF